MASRQRASSASLWPRIDRTMLWKAWARVAYGMSRLYWSNLPDAKSPRNQHLVQLVDDGGLADTRISRNKHQLRRAARQDAVEGREQAIDLGRSPRHCL